MRLILKKDDYVRMLDHALACLPQEACGLLGGRVEDGVKMVEKIYLLSNQDQSREHFSISPREQLEAVKDMRAGGLIPLGNFHSHPETPARPSEEDIKMAYDPAASYLILSLAGDAPELKNFHIEQSGGMVREDPMDICP
jgi:proteasome lid subunit RPN8/RPN11